MLPLTANKQQQHCVEDIRKKGAEYETEVHFQKCYNVMAEIWDFFCDMLPEDPGFKFLDLGCAPGGFASFLLEDPRCLAGCGVTLANSSGGYPIRLRQPNFFMQIRDLFDLSTADLLCRGLVHVCICDAQYLRDSTSWDKKYRGIRCRSKQHGVWSLLVKQFSLGFHKLQQNGILIFRFGWKDNPGDVQTIWYKRVSVRLFTLIHLLFAKVKEIKSDYYNILDGSFYVCAAGFDREKYEKINVHGILVDQFFDLTTSRYDEASEHEVLEAADAFRTREVDGKINDMLERVEKLRLVHEQSSQRRHELLQEDESESLQCGKCFGFIKPVPQGLSLSGGGGKGGEVVDNVGEADAHGEQKPVSCASRGPNNVRTNTNASSTAMKAGPEQDIFLKARELKELLSTYARVVDVAIVGDCGIVRFSSRKMAESTVAEFNAKKTFGDGVRVWTTTFAISASTSASTTKGAKITSTATASAAAAEQEHDAENRVSGRRATASSSESKTSSLDGLDDEGGGQGDDHKKIEDAAGMPREADEKEDTSRVVETENKEVAKAGFKGLPDEFQTYLQKVEERELALKARETSKGRAPGKGGNRYGEAEHSCSSAGPSRRNSKEDIVAGGSSASGFACAGKSNSFSAAVASEDQTRGKGALVTSFPSSSSSKSKSYGKGSSEQMQQMHLGKHGAKGVSGKSTSLLLPSSSGVLSSIAGKDAALTGFGGKGGSKTGKDCSKQGNLLFGVKGSAAAAKGTPVANGKAAGVKDSTASLDKGSATADQGGTAVVEHMRTSTLEELRAAGRREVNVVEEKEDAGEEASSCSRGADVAPAATGKGGKIKAPPAPGCTAVGGRPLQAQESAAAAPARPGYTHTLDPDWWNISSSISCAAPAQNQMQQRANTSYYDCTTTIQQYQDLANMYAGASEFGFAMPANYFAPPPAPLPTLLNNAKDSSCSTSAARGTGAQQTAAGDAKMLSHSSRSFSAGSSAGAPVATAPTAYGNGEPPPPRPTTYAEVVAQHRIKYNGGYNYRPPSAERGADASDCEYVGSCLLAAAITAGSALSEDVAQQVEYMEKQKDILRGNRHVLREIAEFEYDWSELGFASFYDDICGSGRVHRKLWGELYENDHVFCFVNEAKRELQKQKRKKKPLAVCSGAEVDQKEETRGPLATDEAAAAAPSGAALVAVVADEEAEAEAMSPAEVADFTDQKSNGVREPAGGAAAKAPDAGLDEDDEKEQAAGPSARSEGTEEGAPTGDQVASAVPEEVKDEQAEAPGLTKESAEEVCEVRGSPGDEKMVAETTPTLDGSKRVPPRVPTPPPGLEPDLELFGDGDAAGGQDEDDPTPEGTGKNPLHLVINRKVDPESYDRFMLRLMKAAPKKTRDAMRHKMHYNQGGYSCYGNSMIGSGSSGAASSKGRNGEQHQLRQSWSSTSLYHDYKNTPYSAGAGGGAAGGHGGAGGKSGGGKVSTGYNLHGGLYNSNGGSAYSGYHGNSSDAYNMQGETGYNEPYGAGAAGHYASYHGGATARGGKNVAGYNGYSYSGGGASHHTASYDNQYAAGSYGGENCWQHPQQRQGQGTEQLDTTQHQHGNMMMAWGTGAAHSTGPWGNAWSPNTSSAGGGAATNPTPADLMNTSHVSGNNTSMSFETMNYSLMNLSTCSWSEHQHLHGGAGGWPEYSNISGTAVGSSSSENKAPHQGQGAPSGEAPGNEESTATRPSAEDEAAGAAGVEGFGGILSPAEEVVFEVVDAAEVKIAADCTIQKEHGGRTIVSTETLAPAPSSEALMQKDTSAAGPDPTQGAPCASEKPDAGAKSSRASSAEMNEQARKKRAAAAAAKLTSMKARLKGSGFDLQFPVPKKQHLAPPPAPPDESQSPCGETKTASGRSATRFPHSAKIATEVTRQRVEESLLNQSQMSLSMLDHSFAKATGKMDREGGVEHGVHWASLGSLAAATGNGDQVTIEELFNPLDEWEELDEEEDESDAGSEDVEEECGTMPRNSKGGFSGRNSTAVDFASVSAALASGRKTADALREQERARKKQTKMNAKDAATTTTQQLDVVMDMEHVLSAAGDAPGADEANQKDRDHNNYDLQEQDQEQVQQVVVEEVRAANTDAAASWIPASKIKPRDTPASAVRVDGATQTKATKLKSRETQTRQSNLHSLPPMAKLEDNAKNFWYRKGVDDFGRAFQEVVQGKLEALQKVRTASQAHGQVNFAAQKILRQAGLGHVLSGPAWGRGGGFYGGAGGFGMAQIHATVQPRAGPMGGGAVGGATDLEDDGAEQSDNRPQQTKRESMASASAGHQQYGAHSGGGYNYNGYGSHGGGWGAPPTGAGMMHPMHLNAGGPWGPYPNAGGYSYGGYKGGGWGGGGKGGYNYSFNGGYHHGMGAGGYWPPHSGPHGWGGPQWGQHPSGAYGVGPGVLSLSSSPDLSSLSRISDAACSPPYAGRRGGKKASEEGMAEEANEFVSSRTLDLNRIRSATPPRITPTSPDLGAVESVDVGHRPAETTTRVEVLFGEASSINARKHDREVVTEKEQHGGMVQPELIELPRQTGRSAQGASLSCAEGGIAAAPPSRTAASSSRLRSADETKSKDRADPISTKSTIKKQKSKAAKNSWIHQSTNNQDAATPTDASSAADGGASMELSDNGIVEEGAANADEAGCTDRKNKSQNREQAVSLGQHDDVGLGYYGKGAAGCNQYDFNWGKGVGFDGVAAHQYGTMYYNFDGSSYHGYHGGCKDGYYPQFHNHNKHVGSKFGGYGGMKASGYNMKGGGGFGGAVGYYGHGSWGGKRNPKGSASWEADVPPGPSRRGYGKMEGGPAAGSDENHDDVGDGEEVASAAAGRSSSTDGATPDKLPDIAVPARSSSPPGATGGS
eukprot:g198.t1